MQLCRKSRSEHWFRVSRWKRFSSRSLCVQDNVAGVFFRFCAGSSCLGLVFGQETIARCREMAFAQSLKISVTRVCRQETSAKYVLSNWSDQTQSSFSLLAFRQHRVADQTGLVPKTVVPASFPTLSICHVVRSTLMDKDPKSKHLKKNQL